MTGITTVIVENGETRIVADEVTDLAREAAQAAAVTAALYANNAFDTPIPGAPSGERSALHWAQISSQYANAPRDTPIATQPPTDRSARHFAEVAADSATAAAATLTNVNAAGATQIAAVNAAGATQVSAVNAAGAAALLSLNAGYYGSVQFALENEEIQSLDHATQLHLAGSRSAGANPITSNNASALWNQAGNTMAIMWEIPHIIYNTLNRAPVLFGTDTGGNQFFALSYSTRAGGGTGAFRFAIRGATAASATWEAFSPVVPMTVSRIAIAVRQNGTEMAVDVLDLATGTWYRGTPAAKPAGFVGVTILAFDVTLGSPRNAATPVFPDLWNGGSGRGPQAMRSPRGSFADYLIADIAASDAQIEAIYRDGADVASTLGGIANVRLHAPLAQNGFVNLGVISNLPAVNGKSLTATGKLLPGPNFRRRSTGSIVLDPQPYPGFSALEYQAEVAVTRLGATLTGLTGTLGEPQFRLVTHEGTATDWMACEYLLVTVKPTFIIPMPAWMIAHHQGQVRFSNYPAVVGATHSQMLIGDHIWVLAQSEGVYATIREYNGTGLTELTVPTGAPATIEGDHSTIYWMTHENRIYNSGVRAGQMGAPLVVIGNYIRRRTQRPVMFASQQISGTSVRDLLRDAVNNGRDWETEAVAHRFVINRREDGGIPMTGMVKIGWEAADNRIAYGRDIMFPSYRGRNGPSSTFDFWESDPTRRFFADGTFSPTMRCVELPAGRFTGPTLGATETGALDEANQRDSMMNWSHVLGYDVGPISTALAIEGETLATRPLNAHHPEANRWDGALELSAAVAEAACMVMGVGTYPGVVRFNPVARPHPTNPNTAILTIMPPDKTPGFGLANLDVGYRVNPECAPSFMGMRLRTKTADGNPKWGFEAKRLNADAWSVNTPVDAQIVGADEVHVTFAAAVVPGETRFRYQAGAPGAYTVATVDDPTWRAGQLYFSGGYFENGKEPGFQVAGSNQEIVVQA